MTDQAVVRAGDDAVAVEVESIKTAASDARAKYEKVMGLYACDLTSTRSTSGRFRGSPDSWAAFARSCLLAKVNTDHAKAVGVECAVRTGRRRGAVWVVLVS
jgi:hypothetical protein